MKDWFRDWWPFCLVLAVLLVALFGIMRLRERECAAVWAQARTHADTVVIMAARKCGLPR